MLIQSRGLEAMFAANGRAAVVLRRGPAMHNCLLSWDLERDVVRSGQWMRGRIRLHDLSPNGRWLLYWAGQWHRAAPPRLLEKLGSPRVREKAITRARRGKKIPRYVREGIQSVLEQPHPERPLATWTAISRPPYFTALALWASLGTWTGGGGFAEDGALVVRDWSATPGVCNAETPPPFAVRAVGRSTDFARSARRAAVPEDGFGRDLADALAAQGARLLHWIDEDPRFGLTFACDRRIYRADRSPGLLTRPFEAARLIGDLADLRFERVPPPAEALVW